MHALVRKLIDPWDSIVEKGPRMLAGRPARVRAQACVYARMHTRTHTDMYTYIYKYIYIYIYRERERAVCMCMCVYIYIYRYMHMYNVIILIIITIIMMIILTRTRIRNMCSMLHASCIRVWVLCWFSLLLLLLLSLSLSWSLLLLLTLLLLLSLLCVFSLSLYIYIYIYIYVSCLWLKNLARFYVFWNWPGTQISTWGARLPYSKRTAGAAPSPRSDSKRWSKYLA